MLEWRILCRNIRGAVSWAVSACSPAALRVQEDNQEELQRVLGVEFAKDDEEEEEEHAGAFPALVLGAGQVFGWHSAYHGFGLPVETLCGGEYSVQRARLPLQGNH